MASRTAGWPVRRTRIKAIGKDGDLQMKEQHERSSWERQLTDRRWILLALAGTSAASVSYPWLRRKERAGMGREIITSIFGVPTEESGLSQGYRVGDTAYISGQLSQNRAGNLVHAGDIAGQTRATLENLDRALNGLGLERNNLAMVKILLVNLRENHGPASKIFTAYHAGHSPAVTLYGVTALSSPQQLIEISAIARE